jgi:hypothetical protein
VALARLVARTRTARCRDGRVHVRGLRHITVRTLPSALEIMKEGAANKKVRGAPGMFHRGVTA